MARVAPNEILTWNSKPAADRLTSNRYITWLLSHAQSRQIVGPWREHWAIILSCIWLFMLFHHLLRSYLQQSAGVHVEMVSAPDPTCAPVPMARLPHPVDRSQVVQHIPFYTTTHSTDVFYYLVCIFQINGYLADTWDVRKSKKEYMWECGVFNDPCLYILNKGMVQCNYKKTWCLRIYRYKSLSKWWKQKYTVLP